IGDVLVETLIRASALVAAESVAELHAEARAAVDAAAGRVVVERQGPAVEVVLGDDVDDRLVGHVSSVERDFPIAVDRRERETKVEPVMLVDEVDRMAPVALEIASREKQIRVERPDESRAERER